MFLVAGVFTLSHSGVLGHVRGLVGFLFVEGGRVKAAMKIGVGLGVEVIREQLAAIAKDAGQGIIVTWILCMEGRERRVDDDGQAKDQPEQCNEQDVRAAKHSHDGFLEVR